MAPKGTPAPIIEKANGIIRASFESADIRSKLAALGVEFVPSTPESLDRFIQTEREKWGALIRQRGLKADQ